ncbi:unnamed protein product, partial [Mesorhabditis spiculigera]
MVRLLGRTALAVHGGCAGLPRKSGVQPSRARDVVGLSAGLGDAAADHLLDQQRVDSPTGRERPFVPLRGSRRRADRRANLRACRSVYGQPRRLLGRRHQWHSLHSPEGIDFTDPDIYAERMPFEFAELRKTAPDGGIRSPGNRGQGSLAAKRHLLDPREHCDSSLRRRHPRENVEMQRFILINKDAPEHTKLQAGFTRGFTRRSHQQPARRGRPSAPKRSSRLRLPVVPETSWFGVASELPLQAIAELLGVPAGRSNEALRLVNQMTSYDDPEFDIDPQAASMEYSGEYACTRWRISARSVPPMTSSPSSSKLTSTEMSSPPEEIRLLRDSACVAFLDNPDQWELYKKERPGHRLADEIVRWAASVTSFSGAPRSKTLNSGTEDQEEGDRVVMMYASANFGEDVFENPTKFDIMRGLNPHLGFGGTGAHFCIGANLARLEIDLIFQRDRRSPTPTSPGSGDPPSPARSGWLSGIKEFQVDYKTSGCPVKR